MLVCGIIVECSVEENYENSNIETYRELGSSCLNWKGPFWELFAATHSKRSEMVSSSRGQSVPKAPFHTTCHTIRLNIGLKMHIVKADINAIKKRHNILNIDYSSRRLRIIN